VPAAIYGGHDVCAYLAAGHSAMEAMEQGQKNNPTFTRAEQIAYVDSAIEVYCPRYMQISGTLA
jgi:hypothetical protein